MGHVDMHTHFVLPIVEETLAKHGVDAAAIEGFPGPMSGIDKEIDVMKPGPCFWNIQATLDHMEIVGNDLSILTCSTPYFDFGDPEETAYVARACNEEVDGYKKAYPDKIGYAATLPMPYVDKCLDEIAYAFDVLDADGVKVPTNASGVYLGDNRLDPIWEELDRRGAIVFIHPEAAPAIPQNVFTAGPKPLFEYFADTSRAVINMLTSGTIERFPNVKFVVPHAGAFIPTLAHRLIGISENLLIPFGMMEPCDVKGQLGMLYYDLAGDATPVGAGALLHIADDQHIMYGSDFPHTRAFHGNAKKEALLNYEPFADLDKDAIFRTNALRLLGRL